MTNRVRLFVVVASLLICSVGGRCFAQGDPSGWNSTLVTNLIQRVGAIQSSNQSISEDIEAVAETLSEGNTSKRLTRVDALLIVIAGLAAIDLGWRIFGTIISSRNHWMGADR